MCSARSLCSDRSEPGELTSCLASGGGAIGGSGRPGKGRRGTEQ